MSLPPIATATLQAALVNAGSNVLAQGIKAWRDQVRGFYLMLSYAS
jgi:protein Mpv17